MPLENLLHLEYLDFVDCVEHVDYEHFDYKEGKLKERGGERTPTAPLGAEEALLILDKSPAWSGGCVANLGEVALLGWILAGLLWEPPGKN